MQERMRKRASLEQLFGSKVRLRLLKLFLDNPDQLLYVREITRRIRSHIHSVRRELSNLCRMGLIHIQEEPGFARNGNGVKRKFYVANPECIIFPELRALVNKGQLLLQEELARQLKLTGSVRYLAMTGFFVDLQGFRTDLFIVGRINKRQCAGIIKDFEEEFGRTINYTIFSVKEFVDRKEMMDRFLYDFLENKKIVLIDKLPVSQRIGV